MKNGRADVRRTSPHVLFFISKCGKNLSQISLCAGSKGDSFPNVVFCCKISIFFRITSETQKVTVWYRKKVIYREESLWNSEQCTVRNGGPYGGVQEVYSILTTSLITIFVHINLKRKAIFTKNNRHTYMVFYSEKFFWKQLGIQ